MVGWSVIVILVRLQNGLKSAGLVPVNSHSENHVSYHITERISAGIVRQITIIKLLFFYMFSTKI